MIEHLFEDLSENGKQFRIVAIVRPVEYNVGGILIFDEVFEMEFMTANQASKKWKISQRRVQILCAEGRIKNVFKLGEVWAIPADAPKPEDKRRKGGDNHD